MNEAGVDAVVVYDVRLSDPGRHLFRVTCRVNDPDPQGQRFSMPAWIPGSYRIRDFARHVVSVSAESHTEPVAVSKTDKSSWRTGPARGPLLITAEIYAADLSVRGAWLDYDFCFFNGVCLFFRVEGHEAQRCVVHIGPPADDVTSPWRIATSMRRLTGEPHEFGAFEASGYDDLIDQPVLAGELSIIDFEVAGVPHEFALAGRHDGDLERLRVDTTLICEQQAAFFGGPLPMDRYSFLAMIDNDGYGGLEHCHSSALVFGRNLLPRAGAASMTDDYRKLLGLISHEYFHLWNVKRIRPAELAASDLRNEAYTRQLWIFEGITSYYDDLMLLRAGVITVDSYLELLGRMLTRVYRSRGRRTQTLEDSSFDAWIKLYQPDENTPNAVISYYAKGAMTALALDLEIRLRTGGRSSLDDVMVALWREYGLGDARDGVAGGAFERLAAQITGLDLAEFFHQALRQTIDPPAGILLAQFGVRLQLRAAESWADAGGVPGKREDRPRPWLGIDTRVQDGSVFVRAVLNDGPACISGLSAGDELIAVDGYRVQPDNLELLPDRLLVDEPAVVHCFRRGELREFRIRPVRPPRDTCYLGLEDDIDEATHERRCSWLSA